MRKIMIKRSFLLISMIMVLFLPGCVKDTYNMKMLSKQASLSPTLAISAVKGDIALSDIVKTNDTVTFDQNKLVILVFKKDSFINLKLTDFSKGPLIKKTATIEPGTFDLNIRDVLNHISGNYQILNPSIIFKYTNSFADSIKINLIASATGKDKTIDLILNPFYLAIPNIPVQQEITASYIIDKTNSNLPQLISIPPETVNYSGSAVLTLSSKSDQGENLLAPDNLTASMEIDIPMDLQINSLQFTDTVNNSLRDSTLNYKDFQFLRFNVTAKNGFPLAVSTKMILYNSSDSKIKSTVEADGILEPAPVDSNGKATGITETTTTIEFTQDFLSNINNSDKIIFWFTFNSPGNGSQEVKIYSDYRIAFNAVLVVKPDIKLN
jgi:hypothetical protein